MKNKSLPLWIFLAAIVALASCKKPVSQLALLIPKDAAAVFSVDPKAITDKLGSSGITIDSLANMFADKNDEYAMHWNDIKNSGIDLNAPFFIFTKGGNSIQTGQTKSVGFAAQIADKDKLLAFLKKEKPGADILSGGKYQYMALGNDYVAGWNDKALIISNVSGGTSAPGKYATGEGTLSQLQLTTMFTENESASIASVGEFRDMLKKTGDIHFWSNASVNLSAIPMLGMTKMSTLLQDTYTEGVIDFENGKAVASAETHYNKMFTDILEKYSSKAINKDMISRYPYPVNGFAIVAFNPKVLLDVLHYLGFDAMADNYISQMGFTATDIVNAFSGDIAFIFSDFKMQDQTYPNMPGVHRQKPGVQFLVNAMIGDKAAFNKVITGLVNKQILSKNGDEYQLGFSGGHDFVIKTTADNLFIASDDALVKAYQAGNNKSSLSTDIGTEISNKSAAFYIDLATMLQNSNSTDTAKAKVVQAAQAAFKNIIAFADKSDGKTFKGNLELHTANTNENSMASIAKFMVVAHEEGMRHKREFGIRPPINLDSLHHMQSAPKKDSE